MKVDVEVIRAPLRVPVRAAWGEVSSRDLVLLRLEDPEGHVGWGEAAPLPEYDGVSIADVIQALEDCHQPITRAGWLERDELLAECGQLTVVPHAMAALDVALWDLAGRRAGVPVWQLLGRGGRAPGPVAGPGPGPGPVAVNYTIAAGDRAGAAREAGEARAAGFRCLKLKVGTGDDAGRVAAVRAAAGPDMALRLDANGAWTVEEARAALRALAPAGIELCEEPVHGAAGVAELGEALGEDAPALAIDETAAEPGALERRLCRAVCLKLGRCGGITGLLAAAGRARRAGYEIYLASAHDGPLGIAAALHAASALAPDRACGLATLGLFERPVGAIAAPVRGTMVVPDGAGLGDGLADWYG